MQPPLDSAACLYRAQPWAPDSTEVPNEGERSEPLRLGASLAAGPEDPLFVADAALGDHLHYPPGALRYATAHVPANALNGDVTFAIRYRAEAPWTGRLLLSVIDAADTPIPIKHFMLTCTTSNKYLSRFWGEIATRPQIPAQSLESADANRTDTVVVTWTGADQTNRLYLNGALAASGVSAVARSTNLTSPLQVPHAYTPQLLAGKVFAVAFWGRALAAEEVAALTSNADWLTGGAQPPPPPPGVLVVRINGDELPGASVEIDGVPVEPPDKGVKVVDVTAP